MNKTVLRVSLSDSVYFSLASFFLIWLANTLYQSLEKTTGKLDLGLVLVIVLSLVLLFFFLAITNIVLSEHENASVRLWERVIGVVIFIITSAIILGPPQ